jgi:Ni,Fe-hydrogenase maturation factor
MNKLMLVLRLDPNAVVVYAMKLLVFGNPALAIDNLAVKVGEELNKQGHDVTHLENPIALFDLRLDDYVIIDVALGIEEVTLLADVDKLVHGRLCSLHDMDMAFFLKLKKALGEHENVRIIALPQQGTVDQVLPSVQTLLATFTS